MEKNSILNFVRNSDDDFSSKELERLYKFHLSKEEKLDLIKVPKVNYEEFWDTIFDFLNKNEFIPIDLYDSLIDNLLALEIINAFSMESAFLFIENPFSIEFVIYLLENSKSIDGINMALFLAAVFTYDEENVALNDLCLEFAFNKYFSYHALNVFVGSKDYKRLHHDVVYSMVNTDILQNPEFYLNYSSAEDPSCLYEFLSKKSRKSSFKNDNNLVNPKKKTEFEKLLKKHNSELLTYQQTSSFVEDFDKFFSQNKNVVQFLEYFFEIVKKDYHSYPYLPRMSLVLFSRCQSEEALAFAIGTFQIYDYHINNKRLYSVIQKICSRKEWYIIGLYALQKHPDFQTYCKKVASSKFSLAKVFAIQLFDINNIDDYFYMKKLYLTEDVVSSMMPSTFLKKISEAWLNKKIEISAEESTYLKNLILTSISVETAMPIGMIRDCELFLEYFIKNHLNDSDDLSHYTRAALLNYCEVGAIDAPKFKEQLYPSLVEKIIYEDEISFIDDKIIDGDFNVKGLSLMMEYYQYYPKELILDSFYQNPQKYLSIILVLFNASNDVELIEDCLEYLNSNLEIDEKYLTFNPTLDNAKKSEQEEDEIQFLMLIAELLLSNPVYYPRLYRIGITYYSSLVRIGYYQLLSAILEESNFYDDNLVKILNDNLLKEKNREVIKLINDILKSLKKD